MNILEIIHGDTYLIPIREIKYVVGGVYGAEGSMRMIRIVLKDVPRDDGIKLLFSSSQLELFGSTLNRIRRELEVAKNEENKV